MRAASRGLVVVGLAAACGSHTSPGPREDKVTPAHGGATAGADAATAGDADGTGRAAPGAGVAPIALAAAPRIDLDANRPRWHLVDRGLVLTLAGEGLRKYDLAYRSPWRPAATVDGRVARVARDKAVLTFPWSATDGDGAAALLLRAHGPGKVRVALDGKKLGAATLDGGWGEARLDVPAGALTAGEHTLTLDGKRVAWDAIEVVPAARAALAPCGAAGWRRVSLYAELPAGAHLVARPVSAGSVRVVVTGDDGAPTVVHAGAAASVPAALALPATEERVVRVDLEAEDCARWDGAQIAVAARPVAPALPPVDNVVLVVIDTLRADRLEAYGETRVKTPWLTAAAATGAVFLRNQSMAPSSPPSHATIHTGQIPRVHGATGDDGEIADGAPVVSAIASAAGLATAFVGNNDFAMTRLREPGHWDVFETPYYRYGKDCAPMVARGVELATAAARDHRRFFVSLLPIEPHVAYRFHEGITDTYFAGPWAKPFGKKVTSAHLGRIKKMKMTAALWDQVRALYDGEVTHVDGCLAALADGLRSAGVLDRTAIIVASDHGEGLGERGTNVGHAYALNRELVDTPLVIVGGVAAARVAAPSSNADIAPTILALLGLPVDPRMQGRSLLDDTRAAPLPRVVASEYGRSYALRAARWHLVVGYDGRDQLFDPVADPAERDDRGATAPIARRYLRDAAGLYLAHREAWHAGTWGALNDLAAGNPLAAAAP